MTVQIIQEVIPPNGQKNLQPGKYFFCINAPTGGYAFQTWGKSGSESYGGAGSLIAPAGLKIGRIKGWSSAIIFGVAGQTITYVYGDEVVAPQDVTDVDLQIASISGSVLTQIVPSSSISAIPPLVTAVTAAAQLFASNGSRRRITVWSDPNNAGVVYLVDPTGVDKIGFIQPGTYIEFDTVSALDYADPVGGNTLYFMQEQ